MAEPGTYAISGTVVLDGVHFPVTGPVGYNNLGRFAQKATVGDYTRDSDDLQSAWILTDFTGGMGRFNLRAGVDENRYWTGGLWAREPYTISLPRRTLVIPTANADGQIPLGTLNNRAYFLSGRDLQVWDEVTLAMELPAIATLDFDATPFSVTFQGSATLAVPTLYIPEGGNGYQTYDGTVLSALITTSVKPVAFCLWDQQLWALQLDGTLSSSLDGVTWTVQAKLDGSERPMNLVSYLDRNDNDVLYVVSDTALWAFDANADHLTQTKFRDVYHPDMGRGAVVWRPGEDLYISAGLQVYDWNLSSATPMGPGNPDGVPAELRGRILGLAPELNTLYAYVEGAPAASAGLEAEALQSDTVFDDSAYSPSLGAFCCVLGWTGFGWHIYWRSPGLSAGSGVAAIRVVRAQGQERLWWTCNGELHTQLIPREMSSMRQLVETNDGDFDLDGYLDTGWFDAGMRGFDKLASHVEMNLDHARDVQYAELSYRIDDDQAWSHIGRATISGRSVFAFNLDGRGFSRGVRFNRIRFLLRLTSNDHANSPLIDSIVFKYLKLPLSSGAWRISIPLDYDVWGSRTVGQIKTELDAALSKSSFVELQFGEHTPSLRVRLTSLDGTDDTGWSDLGRRDIAVAEVPVPAAIERVGI